MKILARAGLVCCLASGTALAKEKGAAAVPQYDFYQVSIQAQHCKLKVLVNDIPNENLSVDATHSSAASAPMYRGDLKPHNTVTLQVEEADADTDVSLNVVGITKEREVVSTNEPGNVLALRLDAGMIAASKTKKFSGRFRANFRKAKPETPTEVIGEEEARDYARYFAGLLRTGNVERLTLELLPFFKSSPEAHGLSDAEARQKFSTELGRFLDSQVFLKDDGGPIEVRATTTRTGTGYQLGSKGGGGLLEFYEKTDSQRKKNAVFVVIAKTKGKIRIADFRLTDSPP